MLEDKSDGPDTDVEGGSSVCNTPNARGAYLALRAHRNRKELCKELGCSQAGITRAKQCFEQGFDPCRNGRHKKLNDSDEDRLVSWILDLLDEGETLYSPKIIEMVDLLFLYYFLYFIYSTLG